MTRVGLTEEEESRLLLLMEGDISELEMDIESSDEEYEMRSMSPQDQNLLGNHSAHLLANISFENDTLSFDEEDDLPLSTFLNSKETDSDEEDNLPLSRFQNSDRNNFHGRKREKGPKLNWIRGNDLKSVPTECNVVFTNTTRNPDMTPFSYFKIFIDDDIINNIVEQTNLYSVQKTANSVNTAYVEICQYLGINILSGIIRMPTYRMYWANETRIPLIADVMSRNRFEKLRTMLHINDNFGMRERDDPKYDKLFKIRPFIDSLRKNFSEIQQEEYNSVDEIMIPFKGHSALKQYIKNKPHKWGIKTFARAGMSGIVYDFEIYVGKGTIQNPTPLGLSGDIVIRLCENLPKQQNYKLFMDNWFNSFGLFRKLKSDGILACGTVRIDRMPNCNMLKTEKCLKDEGRGSYDYVIESEENIIVAKWYDNKCVHVASNYKGILPVDEVRRWSTKDKKYIEVRRPSIIKEYNTYMGGVDLNDMLVSLYRTKIGVKRFYLRIFFYLIDISIVNAWLLYRRDCTLRGDAKHKRLVTFRAEIAYALLRKDFTSSSRKRGRPSNCDNVPSPTPPPKRPVNPTPIDDIRYDNLGHWPQHLNPKKRCRECKTAYSRVGCIKCQIALCLTKDKNCFMLFHNKN